MLRSLLFLWLMKRNGLTPGNSSVGLGEAAFIWAPSFILLGEEPERRNISELSAEIKKQRSIQLRANCARYWSASNTAARCDVRPPESPALLVECDVVRDVHFAVTAWRKRVRTVVPSPSGTEAPAD